MTEWNFADIWEISAHTLPDAPAQTQGERSFTWGQFNARANGIAAHLLSTGVAHQDKVAQYLFNCPEYLESLFACFKIGLVPVNTNYRYTDDELSYLWDNSDASVVVFHGTFIATIERIRERCSKVHTWLFVDDGSGPCPQWATPYEPLAEAGTDHDVQPNWGRHGSDLYFIYTGGTTGMPKGTMWEQDTLVRLLLDTVVSAMPADHAEIRSRLLTNGPGLVVMPVAPLMHGTGALVSFGQVSAAGHIVLCEQRSLSPSEILTKVTNDKINMLVIIGDVMTKPVLAELDAHAGDGTYDISSLFAIVSSGVMWSENVKEGLLAHHGTMMLIDALGSSEAIGMGQNLSAGNAAGKTAKFQLGGAAVVVGEDLQLVQPGSGQIGRLGVRGLTPVGYYKDPEKSAATFPVIDGIRYSLPGDFATIEADGTLVLLGRGSVCINSGGEKIFPEEVEEALKTHPSVKDAVAVGLPDDRWGETVNAIVELEPDAALDTGALIAWVKTKVAPFKAPKHIVAIDTVGRGPNGKVDYKRMKAYAAQRLDVTLPG